MDDNRAAPPRRCNCPACDLPSEDFDRLALDRIMHGYMNAPANCTIQIQRRAKQFPTMHLIRREEMDPGR